MAKRHRGGCSHGVQSGLAPVLLLGCCTEAERQAAGGGHATPWGLLSQCAIWGCSSIADRLLLEPMGPIGPTELQGTHERSREAPGPWSLGPDTTQASLKITPT